VTSYDVLFTAGPIAPRTNHDDALALFEAEVRGHDSIQFGIADTSPPVGAGASVRVTWRGHDDPVRVSL